MHVNCLLRLNSEKIASLTEFATVGNLIGCWLSKPDNQWFVKMILLILKLKNRQQAS